MKHALIAPRVGDEVYSLFSGRGIIQAIEEHMIVLFDNGATKYYSPAGVYRRTHQNSELSYTPWFDESGNYTATFKKDRTRDVVDEKSLEKFMQEEEEFPFCVNYAAQGEGVGWKGTTKTSEPRKDNELVIPYNFRREITALMKLLMIREFYIRRLCPEGHIGPYYVPIDENSQEIKTIDGKAQVVPADPRASGCLVFHSKEMAMQFLEKNKGLIDIAYPLC